MQRVTASIITIGDELLIGQVIDTNSAWIGQALNKIGVWVHRRVAVGDLWEDIWSSLEEETLKSDVVIITGGLGPTADDITKPLLTKFFGGQLITHPLALENVKNIFARYNRPMLEVNLKQAEVPDNCQVMLNSRGTAPGMQFEKDGKLFFSMPGVPYEMQGMMEQHVIPVIQQKFKLSQVLHRTLTTMGLGESFLAERLSEFELGLPQNIKLAYLPGQTLVRLRLTQQVSPTNADTSPQIESLFQQLKALVMDILVTSKDQSVPEAVSQLLLQYGKQVATAESCTGGYLAQELTAIPGASAYFHGGIVSYDNAVKESILQVPQSILEAHGAVSEPVVTHMAQQVLQLMKADYALAVSGILGPTGGTPEKPIGTVWIAACSATNVQTRLFHFRYDRIRNREATASNAFNLLRQLIVEENSNRGFSDLQT